MTEPIADRDGHFDGAHAPDALKMLLDGKNAIVVGPGIGVSDDTKRLIEWLISERASAEPPDADRCRRPQRRGRALVATS